jgi:hypothetical protein
MIAARLTIHELRIIWRGLRMFCYPGSVLVDYRIIQNYAHRLIKQEPVQ